LDKIVEEHLIGYIIYHGKSWINFFDNDGHTVATQFLLKDALLKDAQNEKKSESQSLIISE
jgi:hypothetical protein